MLWLILEACSALFLLVFIVWWTMFSGRKEKSGTPQKPPKASGPAARDRHDERKDSGKV